jgi:hypothetical protein
VSTICNEPLAARGSFVLAEYKIILESELLDIPYGAELPTAQFALPCKSRDVITTKAVLGCELAGGHVRHPVYEYLVFYFLRIPPEVVRHVRLLSSIKTPPWIRET